MKSIHCVSAFVIMLLVLAVAEAHSFTIEPLVEVGSVMEAGNSQHFYWKVGAAANVPLTEQFSLDVSTAYSEYDMLYYTIPAGSGSRLLLTQAAVTENKIDYQAAVNWRFLKKAPYELDLFTGYRGLLLDNATITFHLGAPLVGTRGATDTPIGKLSTMVSIAPVVIRAVSDHNPRAMVISDSDSKSLYGDPFFIADYAVSMSWNVTKSILLKAAYNGEMVTFQRKERFYNGAAISIVF